MDIKLLAVAPNDELASTVRSVASEYEHVELTVCVGDLEAGLASALTVIHADYDAVISRGGTAQVLEDELSIPVIEIEITTSDVLRRLTQLSYPTGGRIAAVGFENALRHVDRAARAMGCPVDTFPVTFADEVPKLITLISALRYDVLLCDSVCHACAQELGLQPALLSSGEDSVRDAVDRAVFHVRHWSTERQQMRALRAIIRNQPDNLIIYNKAGGLVYSDLDESQTKVLRFVEEHRTGGQKRYTLQRDGRLYRVNATVTGADAGSLSLFSISSSRKQASGSFVGIEHLDRSAAECDFRSSMYGMAMVHEDRCAAAQRMGRLLASAQATRQPIMLRGEVGTGKDQIAKRIYLESSGAGHPLSIVDCSALSEQSWRFLMDSTHSPLYGTGQTIVLKCLDSMKEADWRQLLAALRAAKPERRNRVIVSGNDSYDGSSSALDTFADELDCLVITAPPLRKQRELVAPAARLRMGYLTPEGEDAPSISDDAVEMLVGYSWPRNFIQLKQVLDWIHAMHGGARIEVDDVREALTREHAALFGSMASPTADTILDLMRPLEEIDRDVVRAVVNACGGNRTLAAETLKLSRTTVWRLLRDSE